MPDQVKIPGIGDVDKKYVIAGVVVGGGVAVVVYVRAKKAGQAATNQTATQTAGVVTDPAGNTCSAVDPNSGYCPNTPEDTAWQQSNSGYYGTTGGDMAGGTAYGTGTSSAGLVTD